MNEKEPNSSTPKSERQIALEKLGGITSGRDLVPPDERQRLDDLYARSRQAGIIEPGSDEEYDLFKRKLD